jgi:hypothetical protein
MTDQEQEGWYTDPFGLHEARWMSEGSPTTLVRDAGTESYEDVPEGKPTHSCLPIEVPEATGGKDLYRADDADPSHDSMPHRMITAAVEQVLITPYMPSEGTSD